MTPVYSAEILTRCCSVHNEVGLAGLRQAIASIDGFVQDRKNPRREPDLKRGVDKELTTTGRDMEVRDVFGQ